MHPHIPNLAVMTVRKAGPARAGPQLTKLDPQSREALLCVNPAHPHHTCEDHCAPLRHHHHHGRFSEAREELKLDSHGVDASQGGLSDPYHLKLDNDKSTASFPLTPRPGQAGHADGLGFFLHSARARGEKQEGKVGGEGRERAWGNTAPGYRERG
ncbi:hypothetical protein NLG97_g10907 [Lecanicillium saksenae]|uniref:Uncharacterized protein n=1 Tax=Lecanicillium saksenae TaxID=468837 RepID=A0ACC1QBU9_9HYPO|nr:hypothetical protein NLG97_g10907 [Lecanicillium saksenae]